MPDIVYSAATGRIRRVVINGSASFYRGEAVATTSDVQYASFGGQPGMQAFVNSITQLVPSDDRYVSVDGSNNVLSAHIADPACGDVATQDGASLIVHGTAKPGDLLWGGNLLSDMPLKYRSKFVNQPLP